MYNISKERQLVKSRKYPGHLKFQTNGTVGPFTIPKRECYVWGYQPRTRPEGICPVSLPETC